MTSRHSPKVELSVGVLLLGGALFCAVALLFGGWNSMLAAAGTVAGLSGGVQVYRAARDRHRSRDRLGHTPVQAGRAAPKAPAWTTTRTAPWDKLRTQVCSARCQASTEPRSKCRCACRGRTHGIHAKRSRP